MEKRSKSDLDPTQGPAIHCAHTDFLPLGELKPHPRNPNHHPDSQIALLAAIIAEQGWRAPITVSTRSGYVVRGHGRLMAARKLGLAGAPVDRQPYPSDAAELADLVADNRIAELAGMDAAAVRAICDELAAADFDTALAGFPDFGPADGPGYHFSGGSTPFDGPGDGAFSEPIGSTSTDRDGQGVQSTWSSVKASGRVPCKVGTIETSISPEVFEQVQHHMNDVYQSLGTPFTEQFEHLLILGMER